MEEILMEPGNILNQQEFRCNNANLIRFLAAIITRKVNMVHAEKFSLLPNVKKNVMILK